MQFLGSVNFYSNFIEKLHINLKPLYTLLHDDVKFQWTPELEISFIGSPHPIYIFTDHKPLLHCFAKKGNLSPRFYRAQMQLTKFSKLKIIHTPGKNLTVADML